MNVTLGRMYQDLVDSQCWFRWWFGAIQQEAITWISVNEDIWHYMETTGHNELTCNWDMVLF